MTELARIQPAANAVAHRAPNLPQPAAGVTALQTWVETAQAAGQLVASIVDTPFFPAALWPKQTSNDPEKEEKRRAQAIANGTGALIYGAELGLTPMNALTEVFVVHGRPSIYANTMVALLQAAGHAIWTVSISDTECTVHGQRAGSAHVEPVTFTMAQARRAGYVAKNQKYTTDPQAMLYARAASICCKRVAPEVLKGIPSFEEIQDDPAPLRAGAPPVPQRAVTAAELVAAPAAVQPEPGEPDPADDAEVVPDDPADDYPRDDAEVGPHSAGVSREQQRRMFAQFGDLGLAGDANRAGRLAVASVFVGRELGSSNDLTEEEAHQLIDALELYVEQGDDGRAQIAAMTRRDDA